MALSQLKYITVAMFVLSYFFSFSLVFAQQQTIVEPYEACEPKICSSNPPEACQSYCGNLSLNSMLSLLVKVMGMILSVVGSLALLAFVYGGILFLTSAGSRERVEKGKQIIIGAVLGMVVVFASYTIIGFVFKLFGITSEWNKINWF